MEQRGVADGIAFAIFEKHAGCGLAGKLRNAVGEIVVLQVAAPEDAMLAVLIELVVELGNVGVPAQRRWCMEAVPGGVQSIALGEVVGQRVRLEQLQDRRIGADVSRIELLDLVGSQLADATVRARVLEEPVAKIIRGHNSQTRGLAAVAASFIVEEVEEPVFLDWAASGRTENIADQLIARETGQVVKKVVGGERSVSIELIGRTL